MPSKNNSRYLFNTVRSYQKGQLKNIPYKIKQQGIDIGIDAAKDFMDSDTHEVQAADLQKQSFDLGFFKTALENGIDPILATRLLKMANLTSN